MERAKFLRAVFVNIGPVSSPILNRDCVAPLILQTFHVRRLFPSEQRDSSPSASPAEWIARVNCTRDGLNPSSLGNGSRRYRMGSSRTYGRYFLCGVNNIMALI